MKIMATLGLIVIGLTRPHAGRVEQDDLSDFSHTVP